MIGVNNIWHYNDMKASEMINSLMTEQTHIPIIIDVSREFGRQQLIHQAERNACQKIVKREQIFR